MHAGEVDGQHVFETDDGAVGAGRKGLSHVDIEPLDKGFHIRRDMQGAHIGQAGGGIFVLHAGVEGAHYKILDKKGAQYGSEKLCFVAALVVISPHRNFALI